MDKTVIVAIKGSLRPRAGINGAMMEAVVTKATVDEPWVVFRQAANRKGKNRPNSIPVNSDVIVSAIPEFCNIFPKIPPAPVIKIIGAASLSDSPNQPVEEKMVSSNFLGKTSVNNTPTKRAITGVPKNEIMVLNGEGSKVNSG